MGDDSNNPKKPDAPPVAPTIAPSGAVPAQGLDELTGSFARPRLEPTAKDDYGPEPDEHTVKLLGTPAPLTHSPFAGLNADLSGDELTKTASITPQSDTLSPMNENPPPPVAKKPTDPAATSPLEIPRPKFSVRALTEHFRIPITTHMKFVHPKEFLQANRKQVFGGSAAILVLLVGTLHYWRTGSQAEPPVPKLQVESETSPLTVTQEPIAAPEPVIPPAPPAPPPRVEAPPAPIAKATPMKRVGAPKPNAKKTKAQLAAKVPGTKKSASSKSTKKEKSATAKKAAPAKKPRNPASQKKAAPAKKKKR